MSATQASFAESYGLGLAQQVWLFSDFEGYNQLRSVGYAPYLTAVQQARLERIRQARLLHDGKHWRLFLFEGRTQFDFPEVMVNGSRKRPFVPYNLLKLISLKSADLLFGEEPSIKVTDDLQAKAVKDLVERTALHSVLYQAALEGSPDGETFIEGVVDGKQRQVYLKRVDAADVFPEGPILPSGQYGSYVRYNAKNAGTTEKPDWRLLITRYLPGLITREIKQLDEKGFFATQQVLTLNQWPQEDPAADPPEAETKTGLDRPSIVWIPNLLVRNIAVSDYDGLVELQDCLNAKHTQVARVIAKHSDPKLAAPATDAANDGNLRSDYDVYFYRNKEEIPQYITWNAELAAAMEDRRETRSALLTLAEMSPILLGIKEGATSSHNAYKSVRLEAMNSITKAQRKAIIWKAAIRRLLDLAQDLELTIPGNVYTPQPVGVEMRDGIPIDTDARATELANLRSAGLMSVEGGLETLYNDPATVQKELERLEEEAAAAAPSVMLSARPQADGQESTSESPAENSQSDEQEGQDAALSVAA